MAQSRTAASVDTVLNSAEFSLYAGPVSRLYLSAFQRVPDQAGLNNWVNSLQAGNTLQSVADYFAASQEFQLTYGTLNDTQFVTLLYQNVLGRAPDPDGLTQLARAALQRKHAWSGPDRLLAIDGGDQSFRAAVADLPELFCVLQRPAHPATARLLVELSGHAHRSAACNPHRRGQHWLLKFLEPL